MIASAFILMAVVMAVFVALYLVVVSKDFAAQTEAALYDPLAPEPEIDQTALSISAGVLIAAFIIGSSPLWLGL
ncbi:hypothetical protein J2X36_002115 [Methylobacterium sp. BE186]|uniref:hypothetical protein n=1 Tax=Methylobacterium sp. BE186 TaxID=2817715 RepID=UPI002856A7C0|nr:hypothetical protein [Methylobacterium sp. BE186]MDR7037368.1 hypothetical protein [Methylobacterium sp. BE186]